MALFINKNNDIVIGASDKLIVIHADTDKSTEICIPDLNMPVNLSKNQQEALKSEKVVVSTCAFSNCGELFAVTTSNKQLVVYDKYFKLLHNLNVARTVSKVRFTDNSDILIADKTGDVYLYKLQTENCEIVQVLGHLSMVLDVLSAKNDKFIVTCDRDEKIRVSQFPNAYNIVSFCLGHEEFVLGLELFNSDTLISASGDGTIRLWNYLDGKQVSVINTNDYIDDKSLLKVFSEQMDRETVEIHALPITKIKVKVTSDGAIVVCSLHRYNNLLVFKISEELTVNLLQSINFDSSIISFDLSNRLCILTGTGLYSYDFHDMFIENKTKFNNIYVNIKDIIKSCCVTENISVLYKRKFDNVQEYHERKKLRIENKK